MTAKAPATHRLIDVRFLASQPHRLKASLAVSRSLATLDLGPEDLPVCLAVLTPAHFRKTMPAERWPDSMMDVYIVQFRGRRMYVKFHITPGGVEGGCLMVTSFKEA